MTSKLATARSNSVVEDRKSTRLNSSHLRISYAVFCLKKKSRVAVALGGGRLCGNPVAVHVSGSDARQCVRRRSGVIAREHLPWPGELFVFFFNDTATPEIYPLSLHDALPILDENLPLRTVPIDFETPHRGLWPVCLISEEHTSELQSRRHLVCRLLLEKKKQYRCPDRTNRRNLAQPLPGRVFLALRQQLPPHLLTHCPQRIQLLVVKLGSPAHSWFCDLSQPLDAMARCIDLLGATGNSPTAIDRLHPGHDPSQIFGDGQITAHQFLQAAQAVFPVIDGVEMIKTEQIGQAACVDLVTLVAFSQGGILARIAHYQFSDMGFQQVVQPGGRGSFFKGHLQISAQPIDKLQNHAGLGLDHAFHHNLSGSIPHRNRNTFLMHIHADIFSAGHKGRSSSGAVELALQTYSKRGALLYCVALPDKSRTRTSHVR